MKQQNDQSRLAIAQMKDEARMRLQQERQQWKNELAGGIIDTATATFSGIMQNIQDKKITDMVGGMLNGRNLTDLSDSELNGLMTSLYLAKLGIMPNQATPAPTADNTMLNKGKTPTVRDEATPAANLVGGQVNGQVNGQAPEVMLEPLGQNQMDRMLPLQTPAPPANLVSDQVTNQASDQLVDVNNVVTEPAAQTFDMDAFSRIANKPAYQSILTKLNTDFGGNVDDPAFRAWVRQNYTAQGTLDKFLRAYNAGRGQ